MSRQTGWKLHQCGWVLGWLVVTLPTIGLTAERAVLPEKPPFAIAQGSTGSEADQLLQQGIQLFQEGSESSLQQAIKVLKSSNELYKEAGKPEGEALSACAIDVVYDTLNKKLQAPDYCKRALDLLQANNNRKFKALILVMIGGVYEASGEKQQALNHLNQALDLLQVEGDRGFETLVLAIIGKGYDASGEKQQALNYFNRALAVSQANGDRTGEATILNLIGSVYGTLGQIEQALDYFNEALVIFQTLAFFGKAFPQEEAKTLNNIGWAYGALGNNQKALHYFNRALMAFQAQGTSKERAGIFNNIGWIYSGRNEKRKALSYFNQALSLLQAEGDRKEKATILNNIGWIHNSIGEKQQALKHYSQALPLFRAEGDRTGEAGTLNGIAYIYRDQGKLEEALEQINAAIRIVENLRTKIRSDELKTSYFATVQSYYQLKIDLLMQLKREQEAFETSEAARARSLIELLAESRADIRKGVRQDLLEREKDLQLKLEAREKLFAQLSSTPGNQAQAVELQQEIKALYQTQNQLKDEIRRESPAYANLKYPEPLKFSDIQQQLDSDTVLLQYSLDEQRSYLWVVANTGAPKSYTLPSRAKIEQAASDFRDIILLVQSNATVDINELGNALREQILPASVTKQLRGKRLVIAADGILHFIPFAALPDPNVPTSADYIPLIKGHEIVNVTSMSALAEQRRQLSDRPIAPKTLAILADPVFSDRDPRVQHRASRPTQAVAGSANPTAAIPSTSFWSQLEQSQSQRLLEDCNLNTPTLPRLPETADTADKILSLLPNPQQTVKRLGFDANKDWISNLQQSQLNRYKMLLLATHGCVSSDNPQLSTLFLSQVNANGQSISGALRLGDLFNLDLSAELVVLSACQTGLGKQLQGEGIIGFNRGLMYAGAKRVVGSLWSVSAERGTPELMEKFFTAMLRPNQPLSPTAALREAQIQVWEKYRDPNLWAAFTLQGEWRSEK